MIKTHLHRYLHWQTAPRVHTFAVVAPALQLGRALAGHEMLHPRQAPSTGASQ
jgi:hypothetical protein